METITVASSPGSRRWANQLRRQTRAIVRHRASADADLARRLWDIFNVPVEGAEWDSWWRRWGYRSNAQLDLDLGLHPKRAQRLRRVHWRVCVVLGLDQRAGDAVFAIGLAKATLLAQGDLLTRENIDEWVSRARELSFRELDKAVRICRNRLRLGDAPTARPA